MFFDVLFIENEILDTENDEKDFEIKNLEEKC